MERKETGFPQLLIECFLPVFIYYVINNAVVILGLSVMQRLKMDAVMEFPTDSFWFYMETAVKMAGMALGGLAIYPYFKREKSYKETKTLDVKAGVILMAMGSVLSLGLNFLFSVTGFTVSSEQYQQVAAVQFALPLWLACIFYGILSPVAEEIVFRGVVYNTLSRNTTKVFGIVGSALLFGAFHGNLVQMVYGGLMGVILALVYQKYENLFAPVLLHGAANVAVYFVTYFF